MCWSRPSSAQSAKSLFVLRLLPGRLDSDCWFKNLSLLETSETPFSFFFKTISSADNNLDGGISWAVFESREVEFDVNSDDFSTFSSFSGEDLCVGCFLDGVVMDWLICKPLLANGGLHSLHVQLDTNTSNCSDSPEQDLWKPRSHALQMRSQTSVSGLWLQMVHRLQLGHCQSTDSRILWNNSSAQLRQDACPEQRQGVRKKPLDREQVNKMVRNSCLYFEYTTNVPTRPYTNAKKRGEKLPIGNWSADKKIKIKKISKQVYANKCHRCVSCRNED